MNRVALMCAGVGVSFILVGCGGGDPKVSVVDLEKVLDIFEKVLKEPAQVNQPAQAAKTPAAGGAQQPQGVQPIDQAAQNSAATAKFLKRFAEELNKAKLIEDTIGVHMRADGSIEGFVDKNKDMTMSGTEEKHLFRIQIDKEKQRLIASDESGPEKYHRDRRYHFRPGGFFMGYMLGSMLGRQNRYYSSPGRSRPQFSSMKMSPRNYHAGAVSKAKARVKASSRSSGTRSRGGSRSFRGGK